MKKVLLGMALAGLTLTANAVENHFTFDVLSSGPDIYACNAGIKHKNPSGSVGYDVGDSETDTEDTGDWLQDVMEYSLKKYDQWNDDTYNFVTNNRKSANGSNNYVTATGFTDTRSNNPSAHKIGYNTANELSVILSKLKFELSSERYGTEYFVDVCYYGPRFHDGGVNGAYFGTDAEVTFTNLFFKNYRQKSNLLVRATLYCDGSVKKSTSWKSANTSYRSFWNGHNLGTNAFTKCVFRYEFKENSTGMRANIKHGARVKVRSSINDPLL